MLKDQLQKDLTESLKAGNKLKRSVLGMLMTAIHNRELNKRTQLSKTIKDIGELETKSKLTDEEVLEAVAGEVKKRKESIEQFRAGNRPELAKKESDEMEILKAYLPEQFSEAEVGAEIDKIIKESSTGGIKDAGKIIGSVMAKLKGKADGSMVSRLVKEKLS
ncbi:MAG: GatB/YqeY domain-containing protein [Minisyncoccia bacterium]|jgi:uncharacterized protein YqeY